jgi:hypothetical protein
MTTGKRLFSYDPVTGVRKWFRYNESSSGRESEDTFTIETEQPVHELLEFNKRAFNSYSSLDRWKEGRHVASIPMTLFVKLQQRGVVKDRPAFKAWLNDSGNRFFRTSPGRV